MKESVIPAGTLESAAHAVSQQVSSINDTRRGNCVSNLSCSANDISKRPGSMLVESRERRHLRKSQKSLHLLLKPEIARLCEVLHLSVSDFFFFHEETIIFYILHA